MDLNELARSIARVEGKKQELSIAQIKEVLSCLGFVLVGLSLFDAFQVLARLASKGSRQLGLKRGQREAV